MKRFRPYGPRGVMLLGFAVVSLTLGLAYSTQPTKALTWLSDVVPIQFLGWGWAAVGIWLAISAFRTTQARALGAFSGLCFLWGTAYAVACVISVTHGNPPMGYTLVAVFYGLATACAAAVRMVNPATSHIAVVVKPGPKGD